MHKKKNWRKNNNNRASSYHHGNSVIFRDLTLIGYMSVDLNRQYFADLTQLKFLNSIPINPLKIDLNHNVEAAVKRTTDENNEKIELMLKFLVDRNVFQINETDNLDFITYRRTLINIMLCAYGVSKPVHILACYHKGCIYLCSIESPIEKFRRQSRSEQQVNFCAWGYKFEQYLLSDSPTVDPNYYKPVIENEEFSIFYKANFGNFKILYGAQIDGLLTNPTTTDIPNTSDFDTNINFLNNNSFVELKTNREIQNSKQEYSFKRYKLLRCWCQCYLAGLKGLLVGFRNDKGIIQSLQWFDTANIPKHCQREWDQQKTLGFLHYSLANIKKKFLNYQNQDGPVCLKLELNSDREIKVIGECAKDDILPKWYTDVVK